MTTTAQSGPRPRATPRPQWLSVSRHVTRAAVLPLLWTTIVMLALGLVALAIGSLLGWDYRITDAGDLVLGAEMGEERVVISGSFSPLGMVVALVCWVLALATLTEAAKLPLRHLRVLVANGATRTSVTTGLFVALASCILYVGVAVTVLGAVTASDRPGIWGTIGASLLGLVVSTLAIAAISVTYTRWPWWIATPVVVAPLITLPLAEKLLGLSVPIGPWAVGVALVSLLVLVVVPRRLPVR